MSDIATSDRASVEPDEKPVPDDSEVKFPPFPDPTDDDFDEGVAEAEKAHYKTKFSDLNTIVGLKLHCTACDRHLGCSAMNESRMRVHPMLRTLICHTCHAFYNSGEFDKGEDGSELYCRWCGQGGQVYCCSECIHVFCAKCIKRNLGPSKIKEIENTDDWKCFKCNPDCLWDLRAVCWALLRYCDLKNKTVYSTEDAVLREKYGKAIALDLTECCKNKGKRKEKTDSAKKKSQEREAENVAKKIISKMPPTIQVKKFASVNLDEKPKTEKKAVKRSASPKGKNAVVIKSPISIAPCPTGISIPKKFRMTAPSLYSPIRYEDKLKTYNRAPRPRIISNQFNGFHSPNVFNNMNMNMLGNMNNLNVNPINMNTSMSLGNDNINLSLDSLTQGLDFAAVQSMNNSSLGNMNNDDVVCTPDFPLEPLCEVTEENDDDVECITPAPRPAPLPKVRNPPPLVPRSGSTPLGTLPKNVIQMTESDVSVNALTGGLKFRVDPQTLSSNKMYRLPDGRIFAINSNPNMPGGYSATIVSQNPDGTPKVTPRSETFAAKLSAVSTSLLKPTRNNQSAQKQKRKPASKSSSNVDKVDKTSNSTKRVVRESDMKVPVEWFRYNMIDAVDALEYSLSRLHKLKKETTSAHLRSRTLDEMKYLHRTLEQLLTTSSKRFSEIRETLNKEMKLYVSNKTNSAVSEEDEDDDVEILPNDNDDPIFIDENSVDSVTGPEVDLTGVASSEHNDSADRTDGDPLLVDQSKNTSNDVSNDPTDDPDGTVPCTELNEDMPDADQSKLNDNEDSENAREALLNNRDDCDKNEDETNVDDTKTNELNGDDDRTNEDVRENGKDDDDKTDDELDKTEDKSNEAYDQAADADHAEKCVAIPRDTINEEKGTITDDKPNSPIGGEVDSNESLSSEKKADLENDKDPVVDMSEEMIENLLNDDNIDENATMDISDLQEAEQILS